jgi:hypothetical protein
MGASGVDSGGGAPGAPALSKKWLPVDLIVKLDNIIFSTTIHIV